jgi:hypothetical protein
MIADSLRQATPRPAASADCRPATPEATCASAYGTRRRRSRATVNWCSEQVSGSTSSRTGSPRATRMPVAPSQASDSRRITADARGSAADTPAMFIARPTSKSPRA